MTPSRVETTKVVDQQTAELAMQPATGSSVEREVQPGVFELARGPFTHYRRTVTRRDLDGGQVEVRQVVEYELAVHAWRFLFGPGVRAEFRRVPLRPRPAWWAPPSALDARGARAIDALGVLSIVAGYLGTLMTQTIAFSGDEFGVGDTGRGVALAALRVDIVIAMVCVAWADRHGRRKAMVGGCIAASLLTVLGSASPSLAVLVALQIPARGLTTAALILIGIVAAEEVPAGSRAWTASILAMANALGAGLAVFTLPLADLGRRGWRFSFVLAIFLIPLTLATRHLGESRRFVRHVGDTTIRLAGHGRRLALLAAGAFLTFIFVTPASQMQNTFLKDERGFSAARIAVFTIATGTPGGIGVIVGGQLADRRGRRSVAAVAMALSVVAIAAAYLATGAPLWILTTAGTIAAGATVPALAVYGPELFPTAIRGRANGVITAVGRVGSAVGLVAAGFLGDRIGTRTGIHLPRRRSSPALPPDPGRLPGDRRQGARGTQPRGRPTAASRR